MCASFSKSKLFIFVFHFLELSILNSWGSLWHYHPNPLLGLSSHLAEDS